MLRINAGTFVKIVDEMQTLDNARATRSSRSNGQPLEEDGLSIIRDTGAAFCEWAEDLHLDVTARVGADIVKANTLSEFDVAFTQFRRTMRAELDAKTFIVLSPELASYMDKNEPFGPEVEAKFSEAHDDIEEAAKCLALERNKAAVCHLMLAMEVALRTLASALGATVQDKDDRWLPWLVIANNMEPKIKLLPEGDAKTAWWEVHSMLTSVGRAWRNPTMHPAKSYDAAQAMKVFDAVKGFMNDLAALV